MRRLVVWLLCLAISLGAQSAVSGQADVTSLRVKLTNFRNNVQAAAKLLDVSKLRVRVNERVEDLVAFGFVNLALKSGLTVSDMLGPTITEDRNFKTKLIQQISAGCGSPGPKPTNDERALSQLRSLMVPSYYNSTVIMIASGAQFARLQLDTELELGKSFYFPLLRGSSNNILLRLPKDVQSLVKEFLLK